MQGKMDLCTLYRPDNIKPPPLRSEIGKCLNVAFNISQNPDNLKSGF